MRASFVRSYRSKNGNATFVYGVSGSSDELNAFKSAQGDYYREDDKTGKPLFFTTRFIGKAGELIITTSGNVVPDMSAFDAQASLAANAKQQQEEWIIESGSQQFVNREKFEAIMAAYDEAHWRPVSSDFDFDREQFMKMKWVDTYTKTPQEDTSRRAWLLWPSVIRKFAANAEDMIADIENTYAEGDNGVMKAKAEAERENRIALRGARSPQGDVEEEAAQR